jgi:glutathione S-transferase
MSFTLYNAPQSTCSQRVRFVLNAKKLYFAEVKLDLLAGDQLKPEYLALNPNGVVPTLDHDGAIVIDSSVIIEYLDEIAPALPGRCCMPSGLGEFRVTEAFASRLNQFSIAGPLAIPTISGTLNDRSVWG